MVDFEKCFSNFIDRREYDAAEQALFSIVRIAFKAGWLSAGGHPPKAQKVFEIKRTYSFVIENEGSIQTDIKLDDEN